MDDPHSGQQSVEARISYPHCWHKPIAYIRRCRNQPEKPMSGKIPNTINKNQYGNAICILVFHAVFSTVRNSLFTDFTTQKSPNFDIRYSTVRGFRAFERGIGDVFHV
jgi:hypothetical protein